MEPTTYPSAQATEDAASAAAIRPALKIAFILIPYLMTIAKVAAPRAQTQATLASDEFPKCMW
jgi:hypothetical protein